MDEHCVVDEQRPGRPWKSSTVKNAERVEELIRADRRRVTVNETMINLESGTILCTPLFTAACD
jgi:hypothetical protein